MKVKIGEVIYDSEKEPIALFLSAIDKKNLSNMCAGPTNTFVSYPKDIQDETIREWLKREIVD